MFRDRYLLERTGLFRKPHFLKFLLHSLTFVNCKGASLVEGFLHNLCPCFHGAFEHLGCNCAVVAMHSLKFTGFYQNSSCCQDISKLRFTHVFLERNSVI